MDWLIELALTISLIIHLPLLGVCVWRVWRGSNAIDRLIGMDTAGTLVLAILVIVTVLKQQSLYIQVALGLAAVGFTTTIMLARHIADNPAASPATKETERP